MSFSPAAFFIGDPETFARTDLYENSYYLPCYEIQKNLF